MKARDKSEWFEMDKPVGEPELAKTYNEKTYVIERIVNRDGEIIWFGQSVNWRKIKNGVWTVLGENESIKPTKTYYDSEGNIDVYEYPEGRDIWIKCELPIYEKMYLELNELPIS